MRGNTVIVLRRGNNFLSVLHAFSYKQNFYKQRQAEIGKKLSNTARPNFWQTCPKGKFVSANEIISLVAMKMKMIIEK